MTLPVSGALDFSDINVELGNSASAQLNIGGSDARGLAGVASGAISVSDFYGASSSPYFDFGGYTLSSPFGGGDIDYGTSTDQISNSPGNLIVMATSASNDNYASSPTSGTQFRFIHSGTSTALTNVYLGNLSGRLRKLMYGIEPSSATKIDSLSNNDGSYPGGMAGSFTGPTTLRASSETSLQYGGTAYLSGIQSGDLVVAYVVFANSTNSSGSTNLPTNGEWSAIADSRSFAGYAYSTNGTDGAGVIGVYTIATGTYASLSVYYNSSSSSTGLHSTVPGFGQPYNYVFMAAFY